MSDAPVCFVSLDGTDAFLRFGDALYRMRAGDERPYEMALEDQACNPAEGVFVFEDAIAEEIGYLRHSKQSCTVRLNSRAGEAEYVVGVVPENIGTPKRLAEFDFRQKPALLLAVRDGDLLVYLSRSKHVPDKDTHVFNRLFLIGRSVGGFTIQDYGNVSDISTPYPHVPRTLMAAHSKHPLLLFPQSVMDTGSWSELGDAVLERVSLEPYDIRHAKDGSLLSFNSRG